MKIGVIGKEFMLENIGEGCVEIESFHLSLLYLHEKMFC